MIVVSNTTPLIGLATIQRFDLLQHLFGNIYIPQAVFDEAVTAGREKGGAKEEVSTADWIETVAVKDRLARLQSYPPVPTRTQHHTVEHTLRGGNFHHSE